jgi:hypothetical protein
MKMRSLLSVLALITLLLFNSCDIFDKLGQVTFDTELTTTFTVDETGTFTNRNYTANRTLDATTDADIQKYKDKLKDFRINDVSYKISGYSTTAGLSDVTFSNGKFSFGDADATTPSVAVSLANALNLRDLSTTGVETKLPLPTDANTLASLLQSDKKLKVYAEGTLSRTPVKFSIEVTFFVSVTADALD